MTTLQQAIDTVRQAAVERRDLLIVAPVGNGSHFLATYYAALVAGPFRAPHHTVSLIGLKGELERAENGVLLLDESPEFRRACLEAVPAGRAPRSLVVATSNPCPCGRPRGVCSCGEHSVSRYATRVDDVRRALDNPVELELELDLTHEECDVVRRLRDETGNWPSPVEIQRLRDEQYPKTNGGRPCGQ